MVTYLKHLVLKESLVEIRVVRASALNNNVDTCI